MSSAAVDRARQFAIWRQDLAMQKLCDDALGIGWQVPAMPYFPPPNIVAALKAEKRAMRRRQVFQRVTAKIWPLFRFVQ